MTAVGESHYQVLDLAPGATPVQVERAYRFCAELYRNDALATYSLLDPSEASAARARIEEAYSVLRDPDRRRAYDAAHGWPTPELAPLPSAAVLRPVPAREPPPPPSPRAAPTLLPGPIDGRALRRFREEQGVSLGEIATRSKVGVRYLEYIEQERFDMLPARVYLRGFLHEYARAVGLEPRATADGYLARLPSD